LKVYCIVLNSS